MNITFLGTGGMVPTKERNVNAIYLEFRGEGFLVDCGEGTQRQMNIAGINRLKVSKILISHWHGDHVAGLVGLIQTLGNVEEPRAVDLYGPLGSKEYMSHVLRSCSFDLRAEVRVHELEVGDDPVTFVETERYLLQAAALKHRIPCIGYRFVEKDQRNIVLAKTRKLGLEEGPLLGQLQRGKSVVHNSQTITPEMVSTIKQGRVVAFVLDTELCAGMSNLAQDADVFVCEANFDSDLEEKAEKTKHLTAQAVAQVASQAGVKRLFLTHFSQRYKSVEKLEEDARKVFPDTVCAYDFLRVKV
jgi:ribonuclease Z